jgi:CPW-WPC domain-containing protein
MLHHICVFSFSICAAASAAGDMDQALPAINVKYDFPSSSAFVSAKESLDTVNRHAMFAKRVEHIQLKTQQLSTVLEEFAKEAHDQLDAVLSVVQSATSDLQSPDKAQPYFLQKFEQKHRVAGVSMNDVEALAADAESASEIYLAAAQSRPSPNDEHQSILSGNVEALGAIHAKLVHEKHEREEAGGIAHCASCERDHGQLCPEGWSEVADGHCSGPSAYNGPCMAFAKFSGFTANDQIEYERACLVCWPCI